MAQKTAQATPGTTRLVVQLEHDPRQSVTAATDEAVALLEAFAAHAFKAKANKQRPRFAPATTVIAVALMRYLFDGNAEHLRPGAATPLVPKIRNEVRALFVLVCETSGVTGTYGQGASWYREVLETRVNLELNRRGLRNRRASA